MNKNGQGQKPSPGTNSNLLFAGNSFGSPGSAEAEQPLGHRENPQETDKDDDKEKASHFRGASFLRWIVGFTSMRVMGYF